MAAVQIRPSYLQRVQNFVQKQADKGVKIFPPPALIYRAFELTPLKSVKVVILAQGIYLFFIYIFFILNTNSPPNS